MITDFKVTIAGKEKKVVIYSAVWENWPLGKTYGAKHPLVLRTIVLALLEFGNF